MFGWIVKYPDTVTGAINISSDTPAVKLTANAVGNISLLTSGTRHYVNRDDYVAIIQNSATCDDVVKIKRLLAAFDPDAPDFSDAVNRFPNRVFLGELNIKYYAFLSALKNRVDHYRDNVYERQRASIRDNTRGMESVCKETEKVLDIMSRKLAITRKWNDKYRSLNKDMSPLTNMNWTLVIKICSPWSKKRRSCVKISHRFVCKYRKTTICWLGSTSNRMKKSGSYT